MTYTKTIKVLIRNARHAITCANSAYDFFFVEILYLHAGRSIVRARVMVAAMRHEGSLGVPALNREYKICVGYN